jgi:NTP pyrophosphatase (non-canonical NTP hydrolase)
MEYTTGLICEPCGHSCINIAGLARLQIEKHGRDRYPTIHTQFIKLVEEVGELGKEINRYSPTTKDKLHGKMADVALALFTLANKLGFDLAEAVESKVSDDKRKFKDQKPGPKCGLKINVSTHPNAPSFICDLPINDEGYCEWGHLRIVDN